MALPPPFSPEEETRLLRLAQQGDRAAFGLLVQAYRDRAFAGAMSLLQNHEDARDLTQDAFIKAFQGLPRFKLGRPFFPWYYRILRNACLSHLERHGPRRKVSLDKLVEEDNAQFADSVACPRERIQQEQMAKHLREALEQLKPEFKEIIAMKHFEDMNYQDIALALKIPIGTVMSRLFHARKALAQIMEKHR